MGVHPLSSLVLVTLRRGVPEVIAGDDEVMSCLAFVMDENDDGRPDESSPLRNTCILGVLGELNLSCLKMPEGDAS